MSSPPDSRAPVVPVPAATVLLLRERSELEVLMVKRGDGAVFGAQHVFPGGKLDADDRHDRWLPLVDGADGLEPLDRALRIAAWREIWEETALLPAPCLDGLSGECLSPAPAGEDFFTLVGRSGARLPLHDLLPLSRWITPPMAPKRFDTWFYICPLDAGEAVADGFETVSADWISPRAALEEAESGRWGLMLPTRAQLDRLAHCRTIAEAVENSLRYPAVLIEPVHEERDGIWYAHIPEGYGYRTPLGPLTPPKK